MAFKPKLLYSILLVFSLLNLHSSSSSSSSQQLLLPPKPTVYELLPIFGLPSGLLPSSVTNYTLSEDGQFEVYLEKPCYIKFDYTVYYEEKITGKLGLGSITELKGIQVQRFYILWFDVDEIRVDLPPSDTIYFTVGMINKELDVDQFLTVRSCKDKDSILKQQQQQLVQLPTTVDDIPVLVTE